MGPIPLCLFLCVTGLVVQGVVRGEDDDNDEEYSWSVQRVPVVLDRLTVHLRAPTFQGKEEDQERGGGGEGVCGIECQSALPRPDQAELERVLAYETVFENGTRTRTEVTVRGLNETDAHAPSRTPTHTLARRKRQVYGVDGRFVISDMHYTTSYPFSTAVRLSTGCSGVLVSPKHVLTAAHCVHDGSDYLDGVRRLKVGVLQLKSKRGRGGRRKGGRGKGGRRREEGVGGEGEGEEEGDEEGNGIGIGGERQEQRRRRGRQRRKKVEGERPSVMSEGGEGLTRGDVAEEENRDEVGSRGGGKRRGARTNRMPRSAQPRKQPVFRWTRVKQTHIPKGWFHTAGGPNAVAPDYDYALLELKRPVQQKHMELGVSPFLKPHALGRIHFSSFDVDKEPSAGGQEKVVYRFCSVTEESDDLLYQHCDAQQGATGAGIYIRLRQEAEGSDKKGRWQRKVIGVFSGHRWVEVDEGKERDYNVAVRITPLKYAQICHWIHGDPSLCQEV